MRFKTYHVVSIGVASFFSTSCVPGADKALYPSLCELCKGDGTDQYTCLNNATELYQDYNGAFRYVQI